MQEFISLTEIGVGCVLIRHTEIVSIELTAQCFSKIELSTGSTKIIEETPISIINKIKLSNEIENIISKK